MDDHDLEKALNNLSSETIAAPEALIRETKSEIHAKRLLPVAVFFSFGLLTLGALAIVYTFISLEIPWNAKICGLMAMLTLSGALNTAVIAARRKIVSFCRRIEATTCHR